MRYRVVLDGEALQPSTEGGRGAGTTRGQKVLYSDTHRPLAAGPSGLAGLASALAAAGRLAALLLAPELGPPRALQDELVGLVRWDGPEAADEAAATGAALVVTSPWRLTGAGDPVGRPVSEHWARSGVPRVVLTGDPAGVARRPGGPAAGRLEARIEWVAAADLVLVPDEAAAGLAVDRLGCRPDRVAVIGRGPAEGGDGGSWAEVAAAVGAAADRLPAPAPAPRPPSPGPRLRAPRRQPRVAVVGPFPPRGGGIGDYNARVAEAVAVRAGVDRVTAGPPVDGQLHIDAWGTLLRPASYDAVLYTIGNSDGHVATIEAALHHPGWVWLHETRLPAVLTTAYADLDDEAFADKMAWWLERAYPGRPPVPAARAAGRDHLALAAAGVGLTMPLVAASRGVLVNSEAARRSLLADLPPLAWHPPVRVLPHGFPPVRPPSARRQPALAASFGVVSMMKRPDLVVDAAAAAGCDVAFVGPCPDILAEVIRDRAALRGIEGRTTVTGAVADAEWWDWLERATVAVQLREGSSGEMSAAVVDALAAGAPVLTNLPSAADYPPGTVAWVDSCRPEVVGPVLARLLADADGRDRMAGAGRAYAAAHSAARLAEAVLDVVGAAAAGDQPPAAAR